MTTRNPLRVDVMYCSRRGCDFVRYRFEERQKSVEHRCAGGELVTCPLQVYRGAFGSYEDLPARVRVRYLASFVAKENVLDVTEETLDWVWNAGWATRTRFTLNKGVIGTTVAASPRKRRSDDTTARDEPPAKGSNKEAQPVIETLKRAGAQACTWHLA